MLPDTATLTGSSGATGSIEFKLYATADCSGPPVDDETVTVSRDGSYATTTGYTAVTARTYQWTASYSGDADNNPAASGCGAESVTITPALGQRRWQYRGGPRDRQLPPGCAAQRPERPGRGGSERQPLPKTDRSAPQRPNSAPTPDWGT